MAEGLMNRVKRLVSGSVNSIVDAVENAAPEAVMKEAIREIDGAIDDVRDQLGRVIANKHHANKRLMEANAKHEDLAENCASRLIRIEMISPKPPSRVSLTWRRKCPCWRMR